MNALTKVTGAVRKWFTGNVSSSGRGSSGGWYPILEAKPGDWQRNVVTDGPRDLLTFSGVYSPLTLIARDISKLRIKLVEFSDQIWQEVDRNSPFLPVLRKPNRYQNRIKFIECWILSKLIYGNAYILKVRNRNNIVTELYVLDPNLIQVLVADNGDIYYRISTDYLSGVDKPLVVPATEVIHDLMSPLFHPLVGISPLYAAAFSATQGRKIQNNSAKFFENMSRPSGALTAPGTISDEVAGRLKREFESNFSGANLGRLFVAGDGLSYEAMTIPAEQAQLIEQLEWTVRDVAACFHMPLFKVGGPAPPHLTIEALNLQYYTDCLQGLIEDIELCIKEGLALPDNYDIELEIENLMRMDSAAQVEMLTKAVGGSIMAPNEARRRVNLPSVAGGDSPMIQQQNYSLAALAKRDAKPDPFAVAKPPAPPAPPPAPATGGGTPAPAAPGAGTPAPAAPPEQRALEEAARLLATLTKGLENV